MRWARPSTMAVLPTPGFTDEHGIVFGASGQDLNHAADLFVTSDYWIEFSLGRLPSSDRDRNVQALHMSLPDFAR